MKKALKRWKRLDWAMYETKPPAEHTRDRLLEEGHTVEIRPIHIDIWKYAVYRMTKILLMK